MLVEFITEDGATTAYTGMVSTFSHGSGAHSIEWDDGVFEPTAIDLHNGVRFCMGADSQFGHAAGCPLNITFLDEQYQYREAGYSRRLISLPKVRRGWNRVVLCGRKQALPFFHTQRVHLARLTRGA